MKKLAVLFSFIFLPLVSVPNVHAAQDGRSILKKSGIQGGLVVHVGCGNGRLTAQLCGGPAYLVYGLERDPAQVEAARKHLQSKNLYGQVTVEQWDGTTLPFIDNLVSLIVADKSAVSTDEIMRVLHPYGVAYIDGVAVVKQKPADTDEWTHYLHGADNNAVAHDTQVGPPRHMQFLAAPLWSRHHDRLASLSSVVTAKGRLFYIVDNGPVFDPNESAQWTVTARNAFNGVFLWQTPIASWTDITRRFRSGPVQLQRLLVTDGDRVFVTLGLDQPVSVLDAASGKVLDTLKGTEKTEEFVLADGTLFVQIGEQGAEQALIERRDAGNINYRTKLIKAIDTATGKTLWRWPEKAAAEIMPRTLAVSNGSVFFQAGAETVCLNAASGVQRWTAPLAVAKAAPTPSTAAKSKRGKRKTKSSKQPKGRSLGWTYATLVVQDDVVLSCDGSILQAIDAENGRMLWQCEAKTPFGKTPSVDILVLHGTVWLSPNLDEGRDLKTGKVVQTTNLTQELLTAGHHHRCYRNKATDRYVIQSYRGLEFRDTLGENNCRHNWIRGICQYGIMPANGMVYLPPHNCGCYPEAKLFGLWTLKSADSVADAVDASAKRELIKGPAYQAVQDTGLAAGAKSLSSHTDWPMHRHDARRSAVLPTPISVSKASWQADLSDRLTAPVIAGDRLVVAAKTTHRVMAFDANRGDLKWSFTTGGSVDSAPTIFGSVVLFGSADGCVYCLRLSDGVLAWRFQAAPANLKTVALQQVESLWPVHGSILVVDNTAYFVAGRSSYIDGGLYLYGVDPISGEIKCQQRQNVAPATALKNQTDIAIDKFAQNSVDYKTTTSPDHSDAFSMAGNLADILVADDQAIYLRHKKLDRQLNPVDEWTHHLFSTSSLLDESESYRSHWFYGNGDFSRLPVAYEWLTRGSYGGFSTPLGRFLVFDDKTLWGAGWKKLALYTTDISNIDERLSKDFPKNADKMTHRELAETLPIHPRAMIKAADTLYLAGYPADTTLLHFSGKPIQDKGILLQINAMTGEIQKQSELPACPMFDGMAAAGGNLYLALENGSLLCLK